MLEGFYALVALYLVSVVFAWFRPLFWFNASVTWKQLAESADLPSRSSKTEAIVRIVTAWAWPFLMVGALVRSSSDE